MLPDLVARSLPPLHGRIVANDGRGGFAPVAGFEPVVVLRDVQSAWSCAATDVDGGRHGAMRIEIPVDLAAEWQITLPAARRVTGRVALPSGAEPVGLSLRCVEQFDPVRHAGLPGFQREIQSASAALGVDGSFAFDTVARTAGRLEVVSERHGRFGWPAVVARRDFPAGGDTQLGTIELAALLFDVARTS
ncbi:MAG: hypothetical protein EXS13_05280 [Planctomycetes bacterium]|nr:hypothetical protein [Planctomycetota bacterium]